MFSMILLILDIILAGLSVSGSVVLTDRVMFQDFNIDATSFNKD